MRVLIVEDEPFLADAIQTGLTSEAIAADVAYDGDAALDLLTVNEYDVVVLDRDVPGTSGDDISRWIIQHDVPTRVIMVTAADHLDDKVSGFERGADDYLAKPFEFRELVVRLRALARRRAAAAPPVLETAGVRLDPFRREVHRDGRAVPLTRKQFAVLEQLMRADGGVLSAETLLARAWDENTDPFSHTVRITISTLRKRLGDPWLIHTVTGVGYWFGEPAADASRPASRASRSKSVT